MKIPKKIKIKTRIYPIKRDKTLMRDEGKFATVRYGKQEIVIDPGAKKQQQDYCFLHELLHAIIAHSSLSEDIEDSELQEKIVINISEDLLLVIRENNLDFRE